MAKDNELNIVTRTLWGEARGEKLKGMVAVVWVIKNRVNQPKWWGKTYVSVCRKAWQFSCWNPDDANYPFLMGRKPIPQKQYDECLEVVKSVLNGEVEDPTKGATHYYNPKAVKHEPKWVEGATHTVTIGNHKFYKDVP